MFFFIMENDKYKTFPFVTWKNIELIFKNVSFLKLKVETLQDPVGNRLNSETGQNEPLVN